MRRITLILIIYLFAVSCSQNKNSADSKTYFDSTLVLNKYSFYPDTQKRQQFECGTSELIHQMTKKYNWASKYKDKFICADYFIKKENINKFIDSFNALDSFQITNFDVQCINWIDDTPLKATDTLIQSSYIWTGSIPEQICILKKLNADSVPIKFNFSVTANRINIPKTITMSVCADSLISMQIVKIINDGHLAKQKQ